jgi:hypothetical protein
MKYRCIRNKMITLLSALIIICGCQSKQQCNTSLDVFAISAPLKFIDEDFISDGGTLVWKFEDCKGKTLHVYFNQNPSYPYGLYLHEYPGEDDSLAVPIGSKDEAALLDILIDAGIITRKAFMGKQELGHDWRPSRDEILQIRLSSIKGPADDVPRIEQNADGYIESIIAGKSSYFYLPAGEHKFSPRDYAYVFMIEWGGLIARNTGLVSYKWAHNGDYSPGNGCRHHFSQWYTILEIYNSHIEIITTKEGPVRTMLVHSILRDQDILSEFRLPSLKLSQDDARKIAIEWYYRRNPDQEPVVSTPLLMLYVPELVGEMGEICVVWSLEVGDKLKGRRFHILLQDQTGNIIRHSAID